jgi:hypothetical protein
LALLGAFAADAVAILATEISEVTILARQATIALDFAESAVVTDLAAAL